MGDQNKDVNGGDRLILHQLGQVSKQITTFIDKQDDQNDLSNGRLRELEKQSALQQQSYETICRAVEKNEAKLEKNDLWTKIIGGLTTFLIAVGTAIVIYLSAAMNRLAGMFTIPK